MLPLTSSPLAAILALVLASVPPADGVWATTLKNVPAPAQVSAGQTVVLAEELLEAADVAALRRAGARVMAYLDFTRPRSRDAQTLEVALFEQSRFSADAPTKDTGLLTLALPDALAYQRSREKSLIERLAGLDGVVVNFGIVSNATYKYSASTRRSAIEKAGLDPYDFYDPLEMEKDGFHDRRFDLPSELLKPMLADEVATSRSLLRPLAEACRLAGKPMGLVCDPSVLNGAIGRRVALNGVWPALLEEGVGEIWIRDAGDARARVASLTNGLRAPGSKPEPIVLYGTPESIQSIKGSQEWTREFPDVRLVVRP